MNTTNIEEKEYKAMIHLTQIEMESHRKDQPYEKAIQIFFKIIKKDIFLYQEITSYLESASYDEFIKYFGEIKKSFYVISSFYGYITKDAINKINLLIQSNLNQQENILAKSLNIPEDKISEYIHSHRELDGSYVFRTINDLKTEVNNVIVNFYQIGKRDKTNILIMDLITLAWDNMFYFNLRTVKQLGYVVSSQKYIKDNYMYFVFLLQGSKSTPNKMNSDIDEVIELVKKRLDSLESDQFNEFKENLAVQLMKSSNNLKESSDHVWEEILNGSFEFNRRYDLFDELKNIKKDDVIRLFHEVFYQNVRKLSIQIFSHNNLEDAVRLINRSEENYNLNQLIKSKVTNDLKILN